MRISFAATNPCHVWQMAMALSARQALGVYYSGYPRWRLPGADGMELRCHSFRTLITYFLHGKVPERWRPPNRALFRWQDEGFDRWVAKVLQPSDFLHGIPGQCRDSFKMAKHLGICTVLNHATGPAGQVAKILQPEYDRLGMTVSKEGGIDDTYLSRLAEECVLADIHCCASSVVREQLISEGIDERIIWVVPYGADATVWNPGTRRRPRKPREVFRVLFAGQLSLRKGIRHLLTALETAGDVSWQLNVIGPILEETRHDRQAYTGTVPVIYHGAISQSALARAMRESDLLVVPSLEDGFGLVVVQALACGLPCAVSSMVGAKDMITENVNGSIFSLNDAQSLLATLKRWANEPRRVSGDWGWDKPADHLLKLSRALISNTGQP